MQIITDFLEYVSQNSGTVVLIVGIGVMLTSSSSAFRTLMSIFGDMVGKPRFTGIPGYIFGFVLSILFLAVIFLCGLIVLTSERLMEWLETSFTLTGIAAAWRWVRFIIIFISLFLVIYALYHAACPRAQKYIPKMPGAFIASAIMVGFSAIYSKLIAASTRYAIVYGSLASIIILLVWMYTCSLVVIMGNVLNVSVSRVYHDNIIEKERQDSANDAYD